MVSLRLALTSALAFVPLAYSQTFQRLGTCPTFGCLLPPDQQDFLPGQRFDIRAEIHLPLNGTEAKNGTKSTDKANSNFQITIQKVDDGSKAVPLTKYFNISEPKPENWTFSWYEDLFAQDAGKASFVNVASKAYRHVYLSEPGDYDVVLTYNNGSKTTARWTVRDIEQNRRAKNVLLFIGDGMTTNMITAARLIAHKSVNGKYITKMAMDTMEALGHQMTHSIDSFITDSANSATALYTGHKSTVNALSVYADSSPDPFDDPKFESIMEIFYRVYKASVGIVSTAFIADATPAAFTAHTRARGQYAAIVDTFIHGTPNYTWTSWPGYDVIMGGGAEQFCKPSKAGLTFQNKDYYEVFKNASYQVVHDKDQLAAASNSEKLLGIYSESNMAKWLDRNVYTDNVHGNKDSPLCDGTDAANQPGLKEMTLKAIDVLSTRDKAKGSNGWMLMSEAASIDKQMHTLDYDRALGELLELDDTIKAAIEHLKKIGEFEDTLIVVTADHGHGFDVFGSADTEYLNKATGDRNKRKAVGTYQNSGLSQYINTGNLRYGDSNFPSNWDPRYTLAQGVGANPDHRENYQVHKSGPRLPAVNVTGFPANDYYVNYKDAVTGFVVNGTLPPSADQGVHSLTDVPIFATGPCHELFRGVMNSIDIFYHMADCLGLSEPSDDGDDGDDDGDDGHDYGHHHHY
ncbi:hypothetical protein AMS68_007068 [Peltaster fructicola]|uniref:alkaline phosphatase n=1 Tax=Peltaster fructicola TaxID=286661 RepID=A0A6H0Y3Q7_9PEZI|nr:hypothetical protein AMS68_007068 [Peltaster fructicola]